MHKILCLISFMTMSAMTFAGTISEPIPLWPKGAPDEKGEIGKEMDTSGPNARPVAGKPVIRLGNVSTPTITVYRPTEDKADGTAVMVCPGGAYHILAMDLEGTEVCEWFNSIGVTAVLLKYRVPARTNDDKHLLPLEDAQRALGLIRSHAEEWKLDPKRIGILGFSAGGHLTAHLCGNNTERAYSPVDDTDKVSCRPDFALMIYPAYLVPKTEKNTLSPELSVSAKNPPTFLTQTEDDVFGVDGITTFYLALKNAKVPVEMHLYAKGGHGYGKRGPEKLYNNWPQRAEEWLNGRGLLDKK